MLRIFAESVRETGRDLQEMDPERLLQGSFRRSGFNVRNFLREDPIEDTALWRNWRILSDFQRKAEDRLLRRIAEKTEEIKSLRDGVRAPREGAIRYLGAYLSRWYRDMKRVNPLTTMSVV